MEIRWEKSWNALVHPHPVPLSLFHFLFSLSLSLSFPWDWGFPVIWALGFPSLTLSLVLHHISFSPPPTIFSFINSSLCLWLLVSVSFCWVSWAYYQCVCSMFVTGQLWQEGRQGWWPLRSWVTQVRCKRCPWGACVSYLCWMPENTHPLSLTLSTAPQLPHSKGKGERRLYECVCVCRPSKKCFAIIKNPHTHARTWGVEDEPASALKSKRLCLNKAIKTDSNCRTSLGFFIFINNPVRHFNLWFFLLDDSHFPDTSNTAYGDAYLCAEHFRT